MRCCFSIAVFISFTVLRSATVQAQFTFKPQPLPNSRVFLLSESGYNCRINSYAKDTFTEKSRHYLKSALGLMTNLNPHYALGCNLFMGVDEEGDYRGGFKLRVRRWLTEHTSANLQKRA